MIVSSNPPGGLQWSASVSPFASQRPADNGVATTVNRTTQQPPPTIQQAALVVAQPPNPIQMLRDNWMGVQNFLASLSMTPSGSKSSSNPFLDPVTEPAAVDADAEGGNDQVKGRSRGRIVPIESNRSRQGENPFAQVRLDVRL